jgi:septal ring factor EnvC (AmiA/AmiB activator)
MSVKCRLQIILEKQAITPFCSDPSAVDVASSSKPSGSLVQTGECHLLLAILLSEMSKMKDRKLETCSQLQRNGQTLSKLSSAEQDGLSEEKTLSKQCKNLEQELLRISDQIFESESYVADIGADIECKLNKQSDEGEIGEVIYY